MTDYRIWDITDIDGAYTVSHSTRGDFVVISHISQSLVFSGTLNECLDWVTKYDR